MLLASALSKENLAISLGSGSWCLEFTPLPPGSEELTKANNNPTEDWIMKVVIMTMKDVM